LGGGKVKAKFTINFILAMGKKKGVTFVAPLLYEKPFYYYEI
jgi:hypothetical protein